MFEVKHGDHYIEFRGARWQHLSCIEHREDGYFDGCLGCAETARETVAHLKAVDANAPA